MFKNTNSIKNQLYRLAILQCLLVIVFWLYLIISKTMSLLNTVNYQISQNSEKILTQLDNDLSVLSRTTLFPVNRSLFANNDSLCSGLRKGSILGNHTFEFEFFTQAQTQLNNSSVDFVAIYDQSGNGVFLTKKSTLSHTCTIRQNADWYTSTLQDHLGSSLVLGPNDFLNSGIAEKDSVSVCVARNLMDPYHYRTIGVCVAGIDVNNIIRDTFPENNLTNQEFVIYYKGKLLFTNMNTHISPLPEYQGKMRKQFYFTLKGSGIEHCLFHGDGTAIIIRTPFSSLFHQFLPAQLLIIMLWTGILIFISQTMFRISRNIQVFLKTLITTCNAFETDYVPTLPALSLPLEFHEVLLSFNHMSDKINTLIHEILLKDLEKRETELQLLRTQINPHYLYNTLEVIHLAAYKNNDLQVAAMAELLGKNLQYGLRGTTEEVSLQEELRQLDIYLSILSYQYADNIIFNKVIDPSLLNCRTIKLLFQPMIENSILHGFDSSKSKIMIDILGYKKDSKIILCVSDNGCGMNQEELKKLQQELSNPNSQSIGIRNVSRRIQLTYGSEYGLSIDSIKDQGSTIIITMPYLPFDTLQ